MTQMEEDAAKTTRSFNVKCFGGRGRGKAPARKGEGDAAKRGRHI